MVMTIDVEMVEDNETSTDIPFVYRLKHKVKTCIPNLTEENI